MGWNDHIDNSYNDFLQQLIDMKHLDGAAEGITKLVIEKGEKALTEKQLYIFKKFVLDVYVTKECTQCGAEIPWEEMYEAHDNGGLCNWCEHMNTKRAQED